MKSHLSAPLLYWKGSSLGKGQPQEIEEFTHTQINTFKLKAVPDFASGRFKQMEHLEADARVGHVIALQKNLLKTIADLSGDNSEYLCGYSLRIFYSKSRPISTEIYLLGRVSANSKIVAETAKNNQREYIESALRSQLYQFEFVTTSEQHLWLETPQIYCYEILKQEEILPFDQEKGIYFYSPGVIQVNKSNRMVEFFEQLQANEKDVCIDITLVPTQVQDSEKKFISKYIEALTKAGRGSREDDFDPDSNTQKAKSAYEDIRKRYFSGNVVLSSFRVFSPCHNTCRNVARQLAACCTANTNNPLIAAVSDNEYAVKTALQVNINDRACHRKIWESVPNYQADFRPPSMMRRLHRLVDLDEAAAFFRLPIPINQRCAGIAYDSGRASEVERPKSKAIAIGNYYENGSRKERCTFGIEELKTHMLIVGGSGSGKTTTTLNMLTQLWGNHQIPFMVFDPKINPEYRYLKKLPEFKDDLLIFTPGQERIAPFKIDPFEVMPGVSLQEHISSIYDCFLGALPLFDPLPSFIQEAINTVYCDRDWNITHDVGGMSDRKTPTMQDFCHKALELAQQNYGKDKQTSDRIVGALRTRLYSLTAQTGIGEMFRGKMKLPLAELMTKPVIFELGGLSKDEQALFSLFILTFVFEYVRIERTENFSPRQREDGSFERATDLDLRHVILVEEAHNLLGKVQTSASEINSKAEVVDKFAKIMREMRATGEGVIVVDQSPAALAQSIVDATNLKLMHRLPSPDDREYLGRAMCLTEGEAKLSGNFSSGECFYYVPGWDAAQRVATDNFKADKKEFQESFTNGEVRELMGKWIEIKASVVEPLNSEIQAQISELQERYAKLTDEIAKRKKALEKITNQDYAEPTRKKINSLEQELAAVEAQIKLLQK